MNTATRSSLLLSLCLWCTPALAATNIIQSNITASASATATTRFLGTLPTGQTRQFPLTALGTFSNNYAGNFTGTAALSNTTFTGDTYFASMTGNGSGLTNASGPLASLIEATNAANTRIASQVASLGSGVSITTYGATPDDAVDDTAAIQAALLAETNLNIPPGRFLCGPVTSCRDWTILKGTRGASWLVFPTNATGVLLSMTNLSCTVQGVGFEGGITNYKAPDSYYGRGTNGNRSALSFRGEGLGLVRDCYIYGFSDTGLHGWGATDANLRQNHATFTENFITNCWRGIHLTNNNGSEYFVVTRNQVLECLNHIDVNSANASVIANTFTDGNVGCYSDPGNGRSHFLISGNLFNHFAYGLYLANGTTGSKVEGNFFYANGQLVLTNCGEVTLANNHVEATLGIVDWQNAGSTYTNTVRDNYWANNSGYGNSFGGFYCTNTVWLRNWAESPLSAGAGYFKPYVQSNATLLVNINPASNLPLLNGQPGNGAGITNVQLSVASGYPWTGQNAGLIVDGDSLNLAASGLFYYLTNNHAGWRQFTTVSNYAVSGNTMAQIAARFNTDVAVAIGAMKTAGITNIYLLFDAGANGLSSSWTSTLTDWTNYIARAQASNVTVVTVSVLPQTPLVKAQITNWFNLNRAMRQSPLPNYFADWARILPDAVNIQWFSDGTHPTAAGYTRAAEYVDAVVRGLKDVPSDASESELASTNRSIFSRLGNPTLTLMDNGSVGVNQLNPSALLQVGSYWKFGADGVGYWGNEDMGKMTWDTQAQIGGNTGYGFQLLSGASPRMTIRSDGPIGIWTTYPDRALCVNGDVGFQYAVATNHVTLASRSNAPPTWPDVTGGALLWSDGTNLCVIIKQHSTGTRTTNKVTLSTWP